MTLREALASIYDSRGHLTPQVVLDEARANRSTAGKALHAHFTWDDEKAGEQWRLSEARDLIRRVRVVYREATESEGARTLRAYHSVASGNGQRVYVDADKIASDEFSRTLLLREMRRDWMALRRRYEHFSEFAAVVLEDFKDKAA